MKYRIFNEDCMTTMQRMIRGGYSDVDVILTSPPYNTSKQRGTWSKEQKTHYDVESVDAMTDEEYISWSVELFKHFEKILKTNGVVLYNISYSTSKPYLLYEVVFEIMKNTDFVIADTIAWKKSNAMPNNMSKNRLTRCWEFVFVLCRKNEMKTFHMNKEIISVRSNGIKQYTCIDNYIEAKNNDGSCKLNKATYSSELCEKLLDIYAPENSVVYDPFNGTGTTGVACVHKNMQWYFGSELSADQCEYSNNRIKTEMEKS
jgi:site-specific DNA-methyltransferase (adenine-specific)/modification methylase